MSPTRKNPLLNVDWITVALYFACVIFGWLNIYSAALDEFHPSPFDVSQEYGKQFLFVAISGLLALTVLYVEGDFFNKFSVPIYIVFSLLLVLVLVIGTTVNGAKAWIQIGGFALQPAEFAKIGVSLMLAKYIANTPSRLSGWQARFMAGVIIMIPASLIALQPDVGSLLTFVAFILALYREGLSGNILVAGIGGIVLGVVSVISGFSRVDLPYMGERSGVDLLIIIQLALGLLVLFLARNNVVPRNRKRVYWITVGVTIAAATFSYSVNYMIDHVLAPHQKTRIYVTLGLEEKADAMTEEVDENGDIKPQAKKKDPGYNARMAKIAVGNGGLLGQGFMSGPMTRNKYVPERWTDFIFSVIAEEWGFIGSALVIAVFVIIILRIISLAERQRSQFSRIYGYCVASVFFLHLLINVGMVIGLAPIIGIPLPFMSYGGSSLIAFTLLLFIFLRLDAERLSIFR